MPLPRLRPLEAFLVESEEDTVVCLQDPEGVTGGTVQLSGAAFFIASALDGKRDVPQVKALFARQFEGRMLQDSEVETLVQQLDEHGLLDTPSYRLRRAGALREFAELSVRPASHAGASYPDDPGALRKMIGGYLAGAAADGSRQPGAKRTGLVGPGGEPVSSGGGIAGGDAAGGCPRGLVVPHIDFERGGSVYGDGYRGINGASLPDLVVVLGVAHSGPPPPFILTRKHFDTPLGRIETDGRAVEEMIGACGEGSPEEEYVHRLEHSIEFQLVWLRSLAGAPGFRILPILCSSFEMKAERRSPSTIPDIAAGIRALRRIVASRRCLVVASVDLAHVGPRFGDEVEVDEALAGSTREADDRLIQRAVDGSAESFWNEGMADSNSRHVDALSAVYVLLSALDSPRGRKLGYGQGEDPAGGLVSFVSIAYD